MKNGKMRYFNNEKTLETKVEHSVKNYQKSNMKNDGKRERGKHEEMKSILPQGCAAFSPRSFVWSCLPSSSFVGSGGSLPPFLCGAVSMCLAFVSFWELTIVEKRKAKNNESENGGEKNQQLVRNWSCLLRPV